MKNLAIIAFSLLGGLAIASQQAVPILRQVAVVSAQSHGGASPSPTPTASKTETAAAQDDQERIRELDHRIQKLELEKIQKSGTSTGESARSAIVAAIVGGCAVLVTGLLTFFGQQLMAQREDRRSVLAAERAVELAKQEAVFKQTDQIVEFRLKQMEQFYAPMFALLGQSKGLYDKMLYQLAQDEPDRYRLLPEPDPQGYRLQVKGKNGEWKGFRLLDQFPAIREDAKAMALAEGIVQIGQQMTEIISKNAGLASEAIIGLLGEYLAHYAILSTIYKQGETEPYEPGWHKMGYYPRELNSKIEDGYREVSKFIDEYAQASKRMLAAFPQ